MPEDLTPLLEWWFQAQAEPVGLILRASDRHQLVHKLYAARAASPQSAELAGLSIAMSPTSTEEIWIIHNGKMRVENAE